MSEFPVGWSSAAVTDLARFVRGVTYTKSDARDAPAKGLLGIIRANNIGDFRFDLSDLVYVPERFVSAEQRLQIGDVVVATSSGSVSVVGKAAPVLEAMPFSFGAFCGVLRPTGEMEPRYFGRYFQSAEYRLAASEAARGVNINNLKRSHFNAFHIGFPGRATQLRIADKLDSLLSRVDACRARFDRVPLILKKFREAVLEAAVSGRLTEEWRGGRNSHWDNQKLGDVIVELRNGLSPKPELTPPGVPILRISSVRPFRVSEAEIRYLRTDLNTQSYELRPKDLLFTRYSGSLEYVGVCGAVRSIRSKGLVYPDKLMRVRVNTDLVLPEWIEIVANSPGSRVVIEGVARTSAGQTGISGGDLKALPVPIPPMNEQREIIRGVTELFGVADSLYRRYQGATARVERLTPSILSKAFRGKLVPQDPNDEPASEMLERMRVATDGASTKKVRAVGVRRR